MVFIFGDHHWRSFVHVRKAVTFIAAPIQYVVDSPIKLVDKFFDYFSFRHQLLTENAVLQQQNLFLRAKVQRITAIENENKQLRALLNSAIAIGNKVLVAQILSVNANPYDLQVLIDKGTSDKVYQGQPVLDADGVFGQVVDVGVSNSRVMLITSTNSAIPVQDSRNGIRAIAAGNGYAGNMRLIYVSKTTDIKVGDQMVTSGFGLKFPQGYPVGIVSKVNIPAGGQFAEIVVNPSAQLNSARQVLLVWK